VKNITRLERNWTDGPRRALVLALLALLVAAGSLGRGPLPVPAARAQGSVVLRIGYQAFGPLNVLKSKGILEKALAPLGATVQWTKFTSGPPLLEALNAGSIDVGATGGTPPIFAQAAGTPLLYIASQPANPLTEAILVRASSPIHRVADLRGKSVALAKASSAHYLLVAALAAAGVPYASVHTVFLQPADARAAFEQGDVDAWSIWDPYYAIEQHSGGVRVLTTGQGIDRDQSFYLAARSFAQAHPEILLALLKQLRAIEAWMGQNTAAVAAFLSPQVGIDVSPLTVELQRSHYGVQPLSPATLASQQRVADTFFKLGLIPMKVQIKDAIWARGTQPF
jgi:sulfonate transport system substrate-binding protein